MPTAIFFAADSQLLIERAGRRCNDIAAQDTKPLPRFNQFFVGKCSDKFAIIVFAEFSEPDRAGHRDIQFEAAEEGEKIFSMLKFPGCPTEKGEK